ncbi:hypothetical protein AOLI_G00032580, partial [Acnodon oligacanthus]
LWENLGFTKQKRGSAEFVTQLTPGYSSNVCYQAHVDKALWPREMVQELVSWPPHKLCSGKNKTQKPVMTAQVHGLVVRNKCYMRQSMSPAGGHKNTASPEDQLFPSDMADDGSSQGQPEPSPVEKTPFNTLWHTPLEETCSH